MLPQQLETASHLQALRDLMQGRPGQSSNTFTAEMRVSFGIGIPRCVELTFYQDPFYQISGAADSPSSVISAEDMRVSFSISTPRCFELTFSVAAKDPDTELQNQNSSSQNSGANVSLADILLR